jgi:glycerol kinase
MNYLVIDSGTSSTKAFLFNNDGQILHSHKIKHELSRPKKYHIESDATVILDACSTLFKNMVQASGDTPIHSVGLAVQRSTFLFWEKESCTPVTPALSWQDSRARAIADEFSDQGKKLWEMTGTPLSAHFGGPKFLHMIRNDSHLKKRVQSGELYFGPLSAFLSQAITGTPGVEESIACRSLLYNLHTGDWSNFALDLFSINREMLPPLIPVKTYFGPMFETDICMSLVIGDQQAALIGHAGLTPGNVASNFGTSGSVQFNAGKKPVVLDGLISSVLYSDENEKYFMVEGTINACNSLFYHLEDELGIPHEKMKWNSRALSTETDGIFIPGFNGIAAPYWTTGFEDIYLGLDKDSKLDKDQIVRAGMESIGFFVNDILKCLDPVMKSKPELLTAAGGAARTPLLQFIADLTGIPVGHSAMKDRTAFGVYRLLNPNYKGDASKNVDEIFSPNPSEKIKQKNSQWRDAIKNIIPK